MTMPEEHLSEIVATHTAELSGIKGELGQMWITLKNIEASVSKSRETNWQTIFMGLMFMGALWAAAIHPLQTALDEARSDARTLAQAVIKQDDKISELRGMIVKLEVNTTDSSQKINDIRINGSPVTDKRITVLEYEMGRITPPPAFQVTK